MKRKKIKKIIEADKIAAGEVVERPANIVKELIENSIDADATDIKIILKKAGKVMIQVIDNGFGIPPDEMEIAFERNTSSKIRSIDDLDSLETLGFRGEALASIAAVSHVNITSKTRENTLGQQLIVDGGVMKSKKQIDAPMGTNIKVKGIFYNVPARQKFLKSNPIELGHITDIIQRYALSYPTRHFTCRHNDLDILNCPANNDLKTTVFHIYGQKIAKYMEEISYKDLDIELSGLIGHGQIAQNNRNVSSMFINQRYIKSDVLFRAIKEAYKGTLMVNKNPFYVLDLRLNPSVVDFNVHPKKLHVRFEDEEFVFNKVYNIIRGFVEEQFIKKEIKYVSTELDEFVGKKDTRQSIQNDKKIKRPIKEIKERKGKTKEEKIKIELIKEEPIQRQIIQEKQEIPPNETIRSSNSVPGKESKTNNYPKIKLLSKTGQLNNNTYIILEGTNELEEEGIYILDQHAASERINKELLLTSYEKSNIIQQKLISPLKVDVNPSEKCFLEENLEEIRKLGFDFEHFGGNTFILRGMPIIMQKNPSINIINDIVSDIASLGKEKSFSSVKEEIINYLACHKSIRGGDELSSEEIKKLLKALFHTKDPFHCAHGRPTLKFISI
ncbi:MAG: DNA mismatch repair endonuclease MutL, partial [Promethearchaeota archaeon]